MQAIKRLIPNLLTAGNLVGGIIAIILTLTGHIEYAPYCIFASAIFDFLDGFVARLLNVQGELGKQLDSLADMVTFGVAPGIMVFVMLSALQIHYGESSIPYSGMFDDISGITNESHYISDVHIGGEIMEQSSSGATDFGKWFVFLMPYAGLLIPVFALFRLAKFNLDTRQTDAFIGLPTPAMTLFFAVLPILILQGMDSEFGWQKHMAGVLLNPIFLISSTLVMSVLMVSEIPLFALKFKTFKWGGNEVRFIFLTISLVLFATLLFWSIPLIIILYLILSIINNALTKTNEV